MIPNNTRTLSVVFFSFLLQFAVILFSPMVVSAGRLHLDVSKKIVPIWQRLKGPFRFLGNPESIKRLKGHVLFNLNDGAGLVPCQIQLEAAKFTVDSLLLIEGNPVKRGESTVLSIGKLEVLNNEEQRFPMRTVGSLLIETPLKGERERIDESRIQVVDSNKNNSRSNIKKKAKRAKKPIKLKATARPLTSEDVFVLVGLYSTPKNEEAENYDIFYLEDATGKIQVRGKFPPDINFSVNYDGLPIKIVGQFRDDHVWALKVVNGIPDKSKTVRYRLLNSLFSSRKLEFQKAR